MPTLQQGANAIVESGRVVVALDWPQPSAGVEADVSAYLLTESGRVRGDHDMAFYNQPSADEGAVTFGPSKGPRGGFEIALDRVTPAVTRIAFCVTLEQAQARGHSLKGLSGARISVTGTGQEPIAFSPALEGAPEAAMIFGELYRRNGQWRFRAVGQGFNGGLAPLARSFGVEVSEPAPAAAPVPAPAPPPPTPAPSPAAAPRPISLSKVSLDKKGQSVSLEKRGASFGEIRVNLNWTRGKRGMFGGGNAIDLDLGCLFELADGRLGVVQALGRVFGAFDQPPFIHLSGDDRTGDASQGETLRINGARWSDLRRIAVFANIYSGVPNWQATDGVVTVVMPDQPEIEVRMTEGRNDRRLCGIVMLENVAGAIRATRIVDYHRDQELFDRAHGFGLRWTAGSKD